MRTKHELHKALASVNVQELARQSGINAKTCYRLRQDPEHNPTAKSMEAVDKALKEYERTKRRMK